MERFLGYGLGLGACRRLLLIQKLVKLVIDVDELFDRVELRQLRQELRSILWGERVLVLQLRNEQRHEGVFVQIVFGAAVSRPRSLCRGKGLSQAECVRSCNTHDDNPPRTP